MITELHVSWAITQASQLLAAGAALDEASVARLGNRICRAADILESWVLTAGGAPIFDVRVQGAFRVPADRVHDLGRIIDQLRTYVETDYFFGVGVGIQEAQQALRQAYETGEPYAFYDAAAGADAAGADADNEAADDPTRLDRELRDDPLQKGHVDQLPGGEADRMKPEDFDAEQLRVGTAHEMEHTVDARLAQEIAMDHLAEDPQYYAKFKTLEKFQNDGQDHWGQAETQENPDQSQGGPQNPSGVAAPEPEDTEAAQGGPEAPESQDDQSGASDEDQAKQQDDTKRMVIDALNGIKAQAAALHQLKDIKPEAFEAVKAIVQALVAMAQQLAEAQPETIEKAEHPRFKSLRLPAPKVSAAGPTPPKYPDALASPASAAGTIKDGKIKVAPVDAASGQAKPQGWNSARAGMVVGPSGSAVSSRQPNTE